MNDSSGRLFIVATPIGNLSDITERARHSLANASLIAAEDTRHSKKLMQHLGIDTPLLAYHDFSDERVIDRVISTLVEGNDVALVSDAGTPLVSDPGYRLVRRARELGLPVYPVPGASALTAGLSVSGIPCDRHAFEGFLPARSGQRKQRLESLKDEERTLVFFEAPHRICEFLSDLAHSFGPDREIFVAREISKAFEAPFFGSAGVAVQWCESDPNNQKGEFVIIVRGRSPADQSLESMNQARDLLTVLLDELPLKQAVAIAVRLTGSNKNAVYELALQMKAGSGES